jgi:hemolysin activation/secretion protein
MTSSSHADKAHNKTHTQAPAWRIRTIALTIALLYSAGSAAQTAPNAGQLQRELQPPPDFAPPKAAPSLHTEEPETAAPMGGDLSFVVKTIHISGDTTIPAETLHALVADMEGASHSLDQLSAAASRITAYYREQGYPVTRAYLPPQEITDGEVTIAVVEGRIGAHKLNNQSRLSDDRAGAYLDTVKPGEIIRAKQIDRGLLILNDTPGVGAARATLQPGASVGTSDLVVDVTPGAAYDGSVDLDNYGNRYVGEYRLSSALNINSPLHIGDVLSFNLLTSGNGLNYGRVAYQLPVGSDGLRVGAAYSDTVYQLGKEFEPLDAHGTATSASLFAAYPFIRSQQTNLNGIVSLEQKNLSDSVDSTQTTTDKRVKLGTIGLQGTLQDGLGGGGITGASLTVTMGDLDIQSASAQAIDAASAQTDGGYTRLAYNLSRLQRLSDTNSLSVAVSGQTASKNLDSSEKFSLGGALGVRAYPQGEAIGDEGYLVNAELRHNFGDALQVILFYDTGAIRINQTPFGAPAGNKVTLSGAGVGVNATVADFSVRASVAWRTGSEQPTSIPASAVQTPTVWVQVSKGF